MNAEDRIYWLEIIEFFSADLNLIITPVLFHFIEFKNNSFVYNLPSEYKKFPFILLYKSGSESLKVKSLVSKWDIGYKIYIQYQMFQQPK